jgi:hypothetical protein
MNPNADPGTEQTSASEKRQSFGEEIPGSRRDQTRRTSRVLDELAAGMGDNASELCFSQIQAKLTGLRRDEIWGPLEGRLAQLRSRGANDTALDGPIDVKSLFCRGR